MSEYEYGYTPVTELVQADYIHSNAVVRAGFGNTSESFAAEFDRWLEQHDADVVKATEERIIKLLEEHQPSELGQEFGIYPCTCGYDSPDIDLSQHHIALIKGEK